MIIDNNSTAPSKNTVKKIDGAIPKSYNNVLKGIVGHTWNGGIIQPVAFKKVYGGTKIKNYKMKGQIRMLTPLVPLATKLTTTFKAFFVPNTRVWKNANKFTAQKGEIIGGEEPWTYIDDIFYANRDSGNIMDTAEYRDSLLSAYYPRIATQNKDIHSHKGYMQTQISLLPMRGYVAIYNDFIRHKELDPEIQEYNEDSAFAGTGKGELANYVPMQNAGKMDYLSQEENTLQNNRALKYRGLKRNNYYTNWRTNLVSSQIPGYMNALQPGTELATHIEWQKTIAQMRESAENAQLNDWDIIAKIRGTRPATQGKVVQLGEKSVGHNYSQVSQTVYNEATPNENFQSLGVTGAYSYTEFEIDLINYEEVIEDGYIHIIAQTTTDTIFSGGIDRELLNVKMEDQYRPELKDLKDDTFLELEIETTPMTLVSEEFQNVGFKRKFSEAFKLPTIISGDLTREGFEEVSSGNQIPSESYWICQENLSIKEKDTYDHDIEMHKWKDNTDYLINNTMALKQQTLAVNYPEGETTGNLGHRILGKNQFKLIAECTMVADLPIDESIKTDFKSQGEV